MTRKKTTRRRVLDRDNYITMYIHSVSNKMSRGASRVFLSLYGVGVIEWRILSILAIEQDVTATWICQSINLDKAAASRSIKALKEQGYVKTRSRNDGTRNIVIELTKKGLNLHDKLLPVAEQREARLLEGLSDRQKQQLLRTLKRLRANAVAMNGSETPG